MSGGEFKNPDNGQSEQQAPVEAVEMPASQLTEADLNNKVEESAKEVTSEASKLHEQLDILSQEIASDPDADPADIEEAKAKLAEIDLQNKANADKTVDEARRTAGASPLEFASAPAELDPRSDPEILQIEQQITEMTNMRMKDYVEKPSANGQPSGEYGRQWNRNNRYVEMSQWDSYVTQNPEKAALYADKYPDIKEALERTNERYKTQREAAKVHSFKPEAGKYSISANPERALIFDKPGATSTEADPSVVDGAEVPTDLLAGADKAVAAAMQAEYVNNHGSVKTPEEIADALKMNEEMASGKDWQKLADAAKNSANVIRYKMATEGKTEDLAKELAQVEYNADAYQRYAEIKARYIKDHEFADASKDRVDTESREDEPTDADVFDSISNQETLSGVANALREAKANGWEGISTEIGYYDADRLISTLAKAEEVKKNIAQVPEGELDSTLAKVDLPRGSVDFPFREAIKKVMERAA
ncbi:MAG: hypothetical protein WCI57_03815 [Candidatus Berkelbacteria bacterium]